MSDAQASIVGPPPPGISKEDRRWAILQWLSVKLADASHEKILEAARDFEDYIVRDLAGREISDDAISNITKLDPGQILAATAAKKASDVVSEPEQAVTSASRQMADRMGRS